MRYAIATLALVLLSSSADARLFHRLRDRRHNCCGTHEVVTGCTGNYCPAPPVYPHKHGSTPGDYPNISTSRTITTEIAIDENTGQPYAYRDGNTWRYINPNMMPGYYYRKEAVPSLAK